MYELKIVRDYRDGKVTTKELDTLSTCDFSGKATENGLSKASQKALDAMKKSYNIEKAKSEKGKATKK